MEEIQLVHLENLSLNFEKRQIIAVLAFWTYQVSNAMRITLLSLSNMHQQIAVD